MAKYLINSTDIEIEEVSGTENLKFNLADGNAVEQMIGDLSNLSTTNKSNVVNAINEVNSEVQNKSLEYIVATISSAQTISATTQVNFDRIARSQGNFTLSGGKIIIGAGINHVRVSACIFVDNWPGESNYLWGLLQLNQSNVATSLNSGTSTFLSAPIPTTIFSVTEGDQIRVVADSPGGGTLRNYAETTWVCIEKID